MAKPTDSARRPSGGSLGRRVFLLTAALVIFSVGAAVLVTRVLVGASVADRDVRNELERSTAVQRDLVGDRLEQLYLRALTVSGDPNFVAYLVLAIEDDDPASLVDQLDERQRDLGFDFAIVLDLEGRVVARTDLRGGDPDFTDQAVWRAAMESGEYSADGLWAKNDELHYAVLVPLATAGTLQGFLVAAYTLGDASALELQKITGAEVVWVLDESTEAGSTDPTLAASTLEPAEAEDLLTWLRENPSTEASPRALDLEDRRYLATVEPVSDLAGEPIGRVVNLGSLDAALAPYRRIGNILAVVGVVAVLVALLASWLLPRKIFAPIRQLTDAAEAAAAGELDRPIEGADRGDEVGSLARSFEHLLSSLREERDMQVYLTELTRTMPDTEGVRAAADRPAEARVATLVGAEARSEGRRLANALGAREALELLSGDMRRIYQATLANGGRIEAVSGHRVLALFDGSRHEQRALSAAAELTSRIEQPPTAVAMVSGRTTTGTVSWFDRPADAITGPPVDALEDLLRAGQPGSLLLSRAAWLMIADQLAEAGVQAQEHRVGWSEEPIYALDTRAAEKLAGPDTAATQNLGTGATATRLPGTGTAVLQTAGDTGRLTLASLAPGRVLGHRFEILSELGAGGMGVVYKARDRELDEPVALKMLKHDAFDGDSGALERLKDELRLARRIAHPNVLRTYDFGEADGFPFISMEFVRGVTLKRLLDQSGRLPLSAGFHMARQLCRGLQAAHAQSVLHRDIKPENVILEPTGTLKLMDFGIAQPIRRRPQVEDTQNAQVIGTPYYLAPEQLEGKEADVRADLYACGVVFYELFTGRLPYSGGNMLQVMQRKLTEDPPAPSEIWPEIPERLEAIILCCLERDRENRYPDIDALLADLDALRA